MQAESKGMHTYIRIYIYIYIYMVAKYLYLYIDGQEFTPVSMKLLM